MKCRIKAESKGWIRVHAEISRMSLQEADVLEYYLRSIAGVSKVKIFDRTCDAVVQYTGDRNAVIGALARFSFEDESATDTGLGIAERFCRQSNVAQLSYLKKYFVSDL